MTSKNERLYRPQVHRPADERRAVAMKTAPHTATAPSRELLAQISEYLSVCTGACLGTPTMGPCQHLGNNAQVSVKGGKAVLNVGIHSPDFQLKPPTDADIAILNRMFADFGFGELSTDDKLRQHWTASTTVKAFMERVAAFYGFSGETYVVFGERSVRGTPTPRSRASVKPCVSVDERKPSVAKHEPVVVNKAHAKPVKRGTRGARSSAVK